MHGPLLRVYQKNLNLTRGCCNFYLQQCIFSPSQAIFTCNYITMHRLLCLVLLTFTSSVALAQSQYEVLKDYDGKKILKGIITRDVLASDTAFRWFTANQKPFPPEKDAAVKFGKQKDSIQLVVFLGTWCEDSHVIIPKLFPFLDASGFTDDRLTLIGVDRNKKTISHLTDAFNVVNVPTVIVMKDGRELGRIVEYGKYGMVENELAEIVSAGK